ncbi:MAG TPA: CehA/McbA family metallohydrolase [Anaerohalosphaeraceae bacterium]|nr:CehA/McbA family metallohydrolase [Anaerohalosphaeraceae bacterium]
MKQNDFAMKNKDSSFCIFAFMVILFTAMASAAELVNPFLQEGQWYKTALHVHSTTSDGDVTVPERMKQYRQKGYDVVAITDHWKTNPIAGLSDDTFLVINGMEAHPQGNHFVCLNLPEGFEIQKNLDAQHVIDMVNAAGGGVIYAHPYWLGHTIDNLLSVEGYIGIEVYNGVCEVSIAKGYGSVHWDQLLGKGMILPAVATDDVHKSENINLGWTMIKAKELTAKAIMEALKSGCYYASCGPTIEEYRVEEGIVKVKCSPAAKICFGGQGSYGLVVNAKDGKPLTVAQWKLPDNCTFVRAEVIDAEGRHAWTNPIVLK